MTAADPNAAPAPGAETDAYVRAHYGYASWALDHPEIGPILHTAAAEGWDEARLAGAIQATAWWKSTSGTARDWDALSATDPATAWQQIGVRLGEVQRAAAAAGITVRDDRISEIVRDSLRFGWQADDITRALWGEARYTPTLGGTAATTITAIRSRAAEFGLPMTDREAFRWTVRIGTGLATQDSLDADLRAQAKALFPAVAKQIADGATVRDLAEPYLQAAGALLEIDPETIRLSDPKFIRPLQGDRQMSLSEWQRTLMTDRQYGWDRTENAHRSALALAQQLGSTFGMV